MIKQATVTKCSDGYYVTYQTSKTFNCESDLNELLKDNSLKKQFTGQGFVSYIKR